ncbi:hypothetical protein AMJ51_00750 [Microgenomates bacterium DG_75]|nr:MAG: hypothetical protein AMJ51_00750 [Microgenomates bacterium DG_75]
MKGKLSLILASLVVILFLFNLFFGIKLNYSPYENELVTLIRTRFLLPKSELAQASQTTILKNILGEKAYLEENLFPLRSFLQIFAGTQNILNLRIFNFLLLSVAVVFFYLFLKQSGWSPRLALISLFWLALSPLFFSLWLFRPQVCLALALITFWLYLWSKKKTSSFIESFLIMTPLALFYTSFQGLIISFTILLPLTAIKLFRAKKPLFLVILIGLGFLFIIPFFQNSVFVNQLNQTPVYEAIDPQRTYKQITERFSQEDGLLERIIFPHWFRRAGYNKIFFAYRNLSQEMLKFFDPETLFFQEVHPLQQKSEVIFYWPLIFLFLGGVIWLAKSRFEKKHQILLLLALLSFVYYLFTFNDTPSTKHSLTLFTLAAIITLGIELIPKKILVLILPLVGWAVLTNAYDISQRPLFWYDNRPYVYTQGISAMETLDKYDSSENIYFTSLVGNPKLYYYYYYSPDPKVFLHQSSPIKDGEKTIHFTGFDLTKESPQEKSLYFGFLGEFIGSKFLNDFTEEEINLLGELGLKKEKVWKLDNTIAFQYSDYFILASSVAGPNHEKIL